MTAMELLRIELIVFVSGLALAVSWKLVTGVITTRKLLHDKITGEFSIAQLQLMLSMLLAAAFYVQAIVEAGGHVPPALPEPNEAILAVVGGSNVIQIGSKFWSLIKLAQSVRS